MSEKLIHKVTELFVCKGRILNPEIGIVWVKKLKDNFDEEIICQAIEKMIWDADGFPTIGKIAEEIENIKESIAYDLFFKIVYDGIEVPEGIDFNYIREVLQENETMYEKRSIEFVKKYKEKIYDINVRKNTRIENNDLGIESLEG